MVVLCAEKAFIERSSLKSTCSRVLTRHGRAGIVQLVMLLHQTVQARGVERPGDPERPRKPPPTLRRVETTHVQVDVCPTTRETRGNVRDAGALDRYNAQQVGFVLAHPAPHTGAHRSRSDGTGQLYRAEPRAGRSSYAG